MRLLRDGDLDHHSAQFQRKISRQANLEISQNLLPSTWVYLLLFVIVLWATPIERRYPYETITFGTLLFVFLILRSLLVYFKTRLLSLHPKLWPSLFFTSIITMPLTWGLFCSWTLSHFELSWTSFFVVLVTSGISAGQIATYAPRMKLLTMTLASILFPSIITNLIIIQGLQGSALAAFFSSFFVLLFLTGRVQNSHYWQNAIDKARLEAVINAVPGTLSWVSSELNYMGVNQKQADFWGERPENFEGKQIGFLSKNQDYISFVKSLFASKKGQLSKVIERGKHTYYWVAQKYNFDLEAVIMGIDITHQEMWQQKLQQLRHQNIEFARASEMGKLSKELTRQMFFSSQEDKMEQGQKIFQYIVNIEKPSPPESFDLSSLMIDVVQFFKNPCDEKNIELQVDIDSNISFFGRKADIFYSLNALIQNGIEATESNEKKHIKISLKKIKDDVILSIKDNGQGIEDAFREIIFEPLFTTKEGQLHMGVGLSLSQEIIQNHNGQLTLLQTAENSTEFNITFPTVTSEPELY